MRTALPKASARPPRTRRAILMLCTALFCSACESRTFYVESSTSWSGSVGGTNGSSSIDGSGDRSFDLGAGTSCWTFQKQTESGTLRAFARVKTMFGTSTFGDAVTSAQFGVVSGCTD